MFLQHTTPMKKCELWAGSREQRWRRPSPHGSL